MDRPFQARLGLSQGEVVFLEEASMEQVSDEVIELAVSLRKGAAANSLLMTARDLAKLHDKKGFRGLPKKLDGHGLFEWKPGPG